MAHVVAFLKIALNEAFHGRWGRRAGGAEVKLLMNGGEMVIGIGVELALKLRLRLDPDGLVGGVEVGLLAGKSVDVRVHGPERPKHVIEGPVLHHKNDNVPEIVLSRAHILSADK